MEAYLISLASSHSLLRPCHPRCPLRTYTLVPPETKKSPSLLLCTFQRRSGLLQGRKASGKFLKEKKKTVEPSDSDVLLVININF